MDDTSTKENSESHDQDDEAAKWEKSVGTLNKTVIVDPVSENTAERGTGAGEGWCEDRI